MKRLILTAVLLSTLSLWGQTGASAPAMPSTAEHSQRHRNKQHNQRHHPHHHTGINARR
jgi:hypothetical protein